MLLVYSVHIFGDLRHEVGEQLRLQHLDIARTGQLSTHDNMHHVVYRAELVSSVFNTCTTQRPGIILRACSVDCRTAFAA